MPDITDHRTENHTLVRWVAAHSAPPVETRLEELRLATLAAVLWLVASVFIFATAAAFIIERDAIAIGCAGAAVVSFLALLSLRLGVSRTLISAVVPTVTFVLFAVETLASGGTRVGILLLGLCVPLVARLFHSMRSFAIWALLVFAVGVVALSLGMYGVDLPLKPDGAKVDPGTLPTFLALHALIVGLFSIHNYLRNIDAEEAVTQASLRASADRRSEEASAELARMRTLSGGVAHDFNNLLCAIRGNAEVAALDSGLGGDVQGALSAIQQCADRGSAVIDELLLFSSRRGGKLSRIDLRRLVTSEFARIEPLYGPEIRFEINRSEGDSQVPEQIWINANADELNGAFWGLVRNAVESIDGPTGSVSLRVGVRRLGASEIQECVGSSRALPGEFAFVEIVDSGRGVDSADVPYILDPFFTTKEQGRGLGLSIVMRAVESTSGALRLEQLESGTLFELLVPLSEETVSADRSETDEIASLEGLRVLVVDDDAPVQATIGQMLVFSGAQVRTASGGQEAIALLAADPAVMDLAVIDLAMPGLSGEETLEELRRICPSLPALMISGHATEEFDRLNERPGLSTLRKPFALDQLQAAVSKISSSQSSRPLGASV